MKNFTIWSSPTYKTLIETHLKIRILKIFLDYCPVIFLRPFLLVLSAMLYHLQEICNKLFATKSIEVFPVFWRCVAQHAIVELSKSAHCPEIRCTRYLQNNRYKKILNSLNACSVNIEDIRVFKHRLSFFSLLASLGTNYTLNWAKKNGFDFTQRQNNVGFVYMCIASNNLTALRWALRNGLSSDDTDICGNSLLAFVMRRSSPTNNETVKLLLSYGASWYYSGPCGESGNDVLLESPLWSRWHLLNTLDDLTIQHSSKPPRKI